MNRKQTNPKKPKYIFILLFVICIVLIAASAFTGENGNASGIIGIVLKPMQSGINTLGGLASSVSEKNKNISTLESENEELRSEVDELQSTVTSLQQNIQDYDDLLNLTGLSEKYPGYKMTGARIIGKDPGNWYNTFTINKGSNDGIRVDMNVIADDGLVGIVTQTGPSSSVVKSIIDDTSSVSAMISKNYDNCIVEGDLTHSDQGLLKVEMISDNTSLVNGDEVVTSYISDKYLPGILIGYISDVQADDSGLSYHANLTPVVDFEHLSTVMVITQLKSEMYTDQDSKSSSQETDESSQETQTQSETISAETANETEPAE